MLMATRGDDPLLAVARATDSPVVLGGRPLHGDPHPRNLLTTAGGDVLWNDFEDAFRGPLEWDLGILLRTAALDGAAALGAYVDRAGGRPDPDLLAACVRLRDWQALCWTLLSAAHRPERVDAGLTLLTRWLAH
jgi:thiamine kinase-like enzyme